LPVADNGKNPYHVYEDINIDDVLDGTIPLDISHGGGKFTELAKALCANLSGRYTML
jgi:hypothetical protein